MNSLAHANIMEGACAALPPALRTVLAPAAKLLATASNYPDIFGDPTRPVDAKDRVDPAWRRFCMLPAELGGASVHAWPFQATQQPKWRPVTQHLLAQAVDAQRHGDLESFVKFAGCVSHLIGDALQPAHIVDLALLAKLLPAPPERAGFHYHTDVEAVTGRCGPLRPPRLLGLDAAEAAWRLAALNTQAIDRVYRGIVPMLQALFAGRADEAESWADTPVTEAAQITADLVYTGLRLAAEDISSDERAALAEVDLRIWPTDEAFHDSVYGAAILDGNRSTPPSGAPIVPARLRMPDGTTRPARGLGVLPHSGMCGPRTCWMRYSLPPGVFDRFEALAGMHAVLTTDGAAEFVIALDGREAFRSGRRGAADAALPIRVVLGAAAEITLTVEDANDGRTFWNNHAFWAEPQLIRKRNA